MEVTNTHHSFDPYTFRLHSHPRLTCICKLLCHLHAHKHAYRMHLPSHVWRISGHKSVLWYFKSSSCLSLKHRDALERQHYTNRGLGWGASHINLSLSCPVHVNHTDLLHCVVYWTVFSFISSMKSDVIEVPPNSSRNYSLHTAEHTAL